MPKIRNWLVISNKQQNIASVGLDCSDILREIHVLCILILPVFSKHFKLSARRGP